MRGLPILLLGVTLIAAGCSVQKKATANATDTDGHNMDSISLDRGEAYLSEVTFPAAELEKYIKKVGDLEAHRVWKPEDVATTRAEFDTLKPGEKLELEIVSDTERGHVESSVQLIRIDDERGMLRIINSDSEFSQEVTAHLQD